MDGWRFNIHVVSPVQNVPLFSIATLPVNRFNPHLIEWVWERRGYFDIQLFFWDSQNTRFSPLGYKVFN